MEVIFLCQQYPNCHCSRSNRGSLRSVRAHSNEQSAPPIHLRQQEQFNYAAWAEVATQHGLQVAPRAQRRRPSALLRAAVPGMTATLPTLSRQPSSLTRLIDGAYQAQQAPEVVEGEFYRLAEEPEHRLLENPRSSVVDQFMEGVTHVDKETVRT